MLNMPMTETHLETRYRSKLPLATGMEDPFQEMVIEAYMTGLKDPATVSSNKHITKL